MKRVFFISDGMVTPIGCGTQETFSAVQQGRSAICLHTDFGCGDNPFVASLLDRSAIECLPGLSFFETVATLAARQAIENAGIDPASERTAIVLSTIKGNVEKIETEDVSLALSAARIAAALGNPNPPVVVSNACISGVAALLQGSRMLQGGRFSHIVVVGCEVQSRFIVTGFQSLKALSMNPCRPFDAARDGLNLGEAAAAVVLGTEDGPWELVCGAVRNDANHISGPSRTGEGSYKVLRYVLESARRDQLAFLNVHGTATLYNDEMEAIAIDRAGLADVPVNALKGYFGHTMGAAGILETILSMKACDFGALLPTRGFETLGVSRTVKVSNETQPARGREFIKLLSGFGGVNGALLLRKGGER